MPKAQISTVLGSSGRAGRTALHHDIWCTGAGLQGQMLNRNMRPVRRPRQALSAGVGFFSLTLGIDVERLGAAFNHITGNHHFFHTIKARQLEHGFEQD